jgi:hypothetical protein
MDEATQRSLDTELRLRGLAGDILEHEDCEGCRINAAQALEFLGALEDTLRRFGIEDPRETHKRRLKEQQARAAAGRPPRLRLALEAEIVVHRPSEEIRERLQSVVQEAVWDGVGRLGGVAVVGSTMGVVEDVVDSP